ncbi:unnamed protein product [Peronospora effusa]|uniref:Uncharacterized protein n=1 Tax=Peronospora effusa TaxID=542832 RepID=A0A3M6VQK8_9STRA|nr:hypothetical protein DD238_004726 [Peronospora effusa]CAI5727395.1 unnamed protein product [Peronospora effusa]
MDVAKLREDLIQCWLAKALVQVLERASKEKYVLVSMGNGVIAEQGAILSELVKGFLRRDETLTKTIPVSADGHAHVKNLKELQQWTLLLGERTGSLDGVLFVIYAPCEDAVAAEKQVRGIIDATSTLEKSWRDSVLLVLHNPTILVGLEARTRAMNSSSMYHLGHLGANETSRRKTSDWRRSFKFITQPLDCLRDQCGWHFVMEIVRWVANSTEYAINEEKTFGAARATMFSSINQLPFQLLLLVLRWSHFHPQLLRACATKLQRQTQLIPQARVRRELAAMQRREVKLWNSLYPLTEAMEETTNWKEELSSSLLALNTSSRSQATSLKLARLSKCCLWGTQKQFYKNQGIRAWTSGTIPFGVSSSSFLAASYARITIDFLLSNADTVEPPMDENYSPNCFVWEAASGSCKFLHSFMLHFTELMKANDDFKIRGLMPLVVATDLSDHVLNSRLQMPCFRPFIKRGQLDFALFDTHEFVHGNATISGTQKTLELLHSRRRWHVGNDGPVVLMGNYFLDSLRADIFTVAATHQDHLPATNANEVHARDDGPNERVVMQVAMLDQTTSNIAEIDISLCSVADLKTQAVYEDDRLNATLVRVLDQFQSRCNISVPASVSSTGLIIFPVEAFEFFLALLDRDSVTKAFPIAILAGDARFSFRNAISSAFITTTSVKSRTEEGFTDKVSLELPQLSPHPDCFCLPVDFEIFEMFFDQLNRSTAGISASTELISSPVNDTFDVFFAAVEPQMQESAVARGKTTSTSFITKAQHTSFKHQFASCTPGDCDMLWGMMSLDDGARCFSADTLLAILAQTGWDFDLFEVLRWELLNRLRRQTTNTKSKHYQNILAEAGIKSWQTFYNMEQQTEMDITMRKIRLQLARWFYELEANERVLEILMPWREKAHKDISSDDVAIFYLLGRTSFRMNEYWSALSFFRLCASLVPTKLKFQRLVAQTLLALQTLRSVSNGSNASDGN